MDLSLRIEPRAEERPPLPWQRMGRYVFQGIRAHPDILAFESCRDRGRVVQHSHERAIWLCTEPITDRGGAWYVEYEIEGERWWDPLSRRRGDELVQQLVDGLLEAWVRWRMG